VALRVALILITACCILTRSASAQDSVKRLLFEDCTQASQEFKALNVEQQMSLTEFLARVVALNTQSPQAPEAFVSGAGAPAGGDGGNLAVAKGAELVTGALWQGLDAKRELKGKRCALELLQGAGALALQVLPTLAETYANQPLSDEMAVGVEETVARIAERAHKENMQPSPEQCNALGVNLFSEKSLAASIVVQEFLSVCLPHIVANLPSDESQAARITSWFREADPGGAATMQVLLSSVSASPSTLSSDRLASIVRLIPLPEKTLLTQCIDQLITLIHKDTHPSIFLPLLGRACLSLGGLTIDAAQQSAIASFPNLVHTQTLSPQELGCLISSAPAGLKRLSALLLPTASTSERLFALEVIDSSYQGLPADMRSEFCARSREIALQLESGTTESSLRVLQRCSDYRAENAQCAFSLLKSLGSLSDVVRREKLFTSVVELLEINGLGKDRNRFSALLSPALHAPIPAQSVIRLATQVPSLSQEILKRSLEVPPSPASIVALQALASTKSFPVQSVPALVELLRYPELHSAGEAALQSVGSAAVSTLRKAAVRPLWPGRASALSALIKLGAASKAEVSEFALGLSTREGCEFVTSHASSICSLKKSKYFDQVSQEHVANAVKRCLHHMDQQQVSTVAECDPEAISLAIDTITSSVTTAGDHARFEPTIPILLKQPISAPSQVRLVLALLERGSQGSVLSALSYLQTQGALPPEILQAVRSVAERNRDTQDVFLASLKVLALHEPSGYDWAPWIKQAIQASSKGVPSNQLLAVVGLAPTDAILAQVVPALESDNTEKLVGGALIGAALGPKAIPIVSRLWHLREARTPLVRAVAVLALLHVNPLTPDLQHEVSQLLVNRYYPLAQALPIKWGETVAVVDMDRSSFGRLRSSRLDDLLTKGGQALPHG
jgi:hypothetical protein